MHNMKSFILFLMLIAVLLSANGYAEPTLLVPDGSIYVPPSGGTLVFEEYYGTAEGRDGVGSIVDAGDSITIRPSDIAIYNSYISPNGAYLPFDRDYIDPLASVSDREVVIDIGMTGWMTTNTGTPYSAFWGYESEGGKKYKIIMRPDNGGTLDGITYSGAVSFPQNQPAVIRFTGSPALDDYGAYVNNNATKVVPQTAWSGLDNQLVFSTGSDPSNSIVYISWIKIYTGVTAHKAPLFEASNNVDFTGSAGEPDGTVNMYDFSALASEWLQCSDPNNPDECYQYWYELD